jgi:hypothetical protein
MKEKKEFDNFDRTMDALLRVSHEEIKAKLEEEKAIKKEKKTKKHDAK